MKKKIYSLRLYYPHDIDLLSFMETHDIDFSETAGDILRAFFNQEFFILNPEPRTEPFIGTRKRICRRELILDEDDEKDQKIISCLSAIKKGCINNFVKNLFRLYLCMPISRNELNWTKPEAEELFALLPTLKREDLQTSEEPLKSGPEESEDVELVTANAEDADLENARSSNAEDPLDKTISSEEINKSEQENKLEKSDEQNDDSFLTDLFSSLIM